MSKVKVVLQLTESTTVHCVFNGVFSVSKSSNRPYLVMHTIIVNIMMNSLAIIMSIFPITNSQARPSLALLVQSIWM